MAITPLGKRLQLQETTLVYTLGAPADFDERTGITPRTLEYDEPQSSPASLPMPDAIHLFAQDAAQLAQRWELVQPLVGPESRLWIYYPKRASGIKTDLSRDRGWEIITQSGFQGVTQVAFDATWTATRFRIPETTGDENLLAAHFAGPRASLLPIYTSLLAALDQLGKDITIQPRKSYVAFSRGAQFAVVRTLTEPRLELGLRLPGVEPEPRLEPARNLGNESISHKVALRTTDDLDTQVLEWLRRAYVAR